MVQPKAADMLTVTGAVNTPPFGEMFGVAGGAGPFWMVKDALATGLVLAPETAMAFTTAEALRLKGAA
jgi:hypothetical protein